MLSRRCVNLAVDVVDPGFWSAAALEVYREVEVARQEAGFGCCDKRVVADLGDIQWFATDDVDHRATAWCDAIFRDAEEVAAPVADVRSAFLD